MSVTSEHLVVFCTVSSTEEGAKIARVLVEEKLAACANLVPGLRSIYLWKGEICDEHETLMVIKTRQDAFERLRARIVELHSYDTAEVIALPIVGGSAPYLEWIDACLRG